MHGMRVIQRPTLLRFNLVAVQASPRMQPICTTPVSRTWLADWEVGSVVELRLTEWNVEQHGSASIESKGIDNEGTKNGGNGATNANEQSLL